MRTVLWCTLAVAFQVAVSVHAEQSEASPSATVLPAADFHLRFTRSIPPAIDLRPAQRITIVEPRGNDELLDAFIDRLFEYVDEGGSWQVEKSIGRIDRDGLARLRRQHPADAYLTATFSCNGTKQSAEGSELDETGARVRRMHEWIDATCNAQIQIVHPDGSSWVMFSTRREGTSPRVNELTNDERQVAYQQAVRYAALNAAGMITPRAVHDSIDLDDSAPQFDEAFSMIQSEQLAGARALWESALVHHRNSAALLYDLGAVCEAVGDFHSAARYLEAATRLAPHNRRYREELEMMRRRAAGK